MSLTPSNRNFDQFKGFRLRHDLAVETHKMVAAPVAGLFFRCCPSAVVWLVVSVIVGVSVNAMCRGRALAKVGEEVLEGAPSVANIDAATTVSREVFRLFVRASCDDLGPNFILVGPTHAVCSSSFFMKTAAALDTAKPNATGLRYMLVSAVALKPPSHVVVTVSANRLDSHQAAIALTGCHWSGFYSREFCSSGHGSTSWLELGPRERSNAFGGRFVEAFTAYHNSSK